MASFIDDDIYEEEDIPVLDVPQGGEDWEGASNAKLSANEAKDSGNYEMAIEYFTKSMELGGPSAITLANRALCLLKVRRPNAAISDCTEALKINPDSAKALRCRGLAYRHLGKWEAALKDIANAQTIDFDPDVEPIRVLVTAKAAEIEAQRVHQRNEDEAILREKVKKQRAELAAQRAREEEEEKKRREEEEAPGFGGMGGMPGGMGGMPGGMGGMPGGMGGGMPGMDNLQQMILQLLMSDPELAAGIQNPKVMKAFTAMMSGSPGNPSDLNDPEVKSFMDKFQTKLGPLMGMMGGMGGMGGGGMPDFGGIPEDDEEEGADGGADEDQDDDAADPATVEEVD